LLKEYASDSFCPYYNQGLFIGSTSQTDTQISMCCWQSKQPVKKVTFDHDYLQLIRQQSQDQIPDKCSPYCKISGHIANERERTQNETIWDDSGIKIKKLHLEQSLICNLTCISCSSRYSSSWNSHYHLFDKTAPLIRLKKNPQSVWQQLDLTDLNQVHFTGGEPLLNPDNKKILGHLKDIGRLPHISLTYNTNGTILPDQELIDLWAQAKWVRLFFSLDGIGPTFEYTRFPANWNQTQQNIQWFRNLEGPCILIEVNAIVGIHNIFNMPEFFKWWKNHCHTGNQGDSSQIFVRAIEPSSYGGEVLSLKNFPSALYDSAKSVLQSVIELPGATSLISKLGTSQSTEWIDYFEKLDKLRKTNWRTSLQGPIIQC
jgi:hypothetical protein